MVQPEEALQILPGCIKPLVLQSSAFAVHGAKLYHCSAGEIGNSLWWEQRHFLAKLEVKDQVSFRKQQAKRSSLHKIAEQRGLSCPSHLGADSRMASTIVLQTALVAAWLVHFLIHRNHSTEGLKRFSIANEILHNYDLMSRHPQVASLVKMPLQICAAGGHIIGELPFVGSRAVEMDSHLLNLDDWLPQAWLQVAEWLGFCWDLPDIQNARLIDWLVFSASATTRAGVRMRDRRLPAIAEIKRCSAQRIASAIELFVLLVYVPQLTGAEEVQMLTAKTGMRCKLDAWTKAGALWRCRRSFGSTATFLCGALQDRNLDSAIGRATCNLFFKKLDKEFKPGCRRLCIQFDPGSYSGHSYNLGLAWCLDTDIATALPSKVSHCTETFTFL